MDRGAQQAAVYRVAKSWLELKQLNTLTGSGFKVVVMGNSHKEAAFLQPHSGYCDKQSLRERHVPEL